MCPTYPDNIGEILSQLHEIHCIDLSYNDMQTFSFESSALLELNLSKNKLVKIKVNCPTLRVLDLSFNQFSFMAIFSGISQQTKNSLEVLNYNGNLFPNQEYNVFTQILRYFKNIKMINGIHVSTITSLIENRGITSIGVMQYNCCHDQLHQSNAFLQPFLDQHADAVNLEYQGVLTPPLQILNQENLFGIHAPEVYKFQVQFLAKFTGITQLRIPFSDVTQGQLKNINLQKMIALDIQNCECALNPNTMHNLKELHSGAITNLPPHIQIVNLMQASFNSESLLNFNKITHLLIDNEKVEDFLYFLPDLGLINDMIITEPMRQLKIQELTSRINPQILRIRSIQNYVLDLSGLGLTSIGVDPGIQHIVSEVHTLILTGNQLSSLSDLRDFPKVKYVDLSENDIIDPFNIQLNHTALETLILNGNPVKVIRNNDFHAPIKHLHLQRSMLKSLVPAQFGFIPSIVLLDLSQNQFLNVSKDTLSKLPCLVALDISYAARDLEIALAVRSTLRSLNCESCKISNISQIENFVSKAGNLQVIRCANNPFCLKYSKLSKSYVFDILESNIDLVCIDDTKIEQRDRDKIIAAREAEECERQSEINTIDMGNPQIKRISSAKPVLQQRAMPLGVNGLRITGIGAPKPVLKK
eukprot:EST42685.1 hypothetical protein SS50377_17703 [Spironucleus salmonicida]